MVTDIGLGVVVAVGVLLGLVAGMVVGWIASRRMGRKDFALQSEAIRAESESEVARLNAEIIESRGQIRVLETDRASLQGEKSSAKSLEDRLEPVREALEGLRRTTQQAEIERAKSAAELRTQIDGVQRNYTSLESATKQLVAAMSSGQSRGQWGEMQLEQLLEQLKLTNERNGSTRQPEPLRAHSLRLGMTAAASTADSRAFGSPSNRGASQSCASSCYSPLAPARSPSAQQ